jgi:ubiquinone/menaquinone biosynthesis C-methylase UbiE
MGFQVMDVTDMKPLADNSFDIAIDKSTIDALLCATRSQVLVGTMLKEVQRILKPGGVYIAISYGTPENRSYLFEMPFLHWEKREFALFDPE